MNVFSKKKHINVNNRRGNKSKKEITRKNRVKGNVNYEMSKMSVLENFHETSGLRKRIGLMWDPNRSTAGSDSSVVRLLVLGSGEMLRILEPVALGMSGDRGLHLGSKDPFINSSFFS